MRRGHPHAGAGPDLLAATSAAAPEFPRFGPAAAELGVHSVLAVGLFPDGDEAPGSAR